MQNDIIANILIVNSLQSITLLYIHGMISLNHMTRLVLGHISNSHTWETKSLARVRVSGKVFSDT